MTTRDHDPVLDRVSRELPPETDGLERLRERRTAKSRRSRTTASLLGLGVTAILLASLVWAAANGPQEREPATGDGSPTPSQVPLVAGEGEFYYVRILEEGLGNEGIQRAQLWVGPDGSGRILWTGREDEDRRFGPGEFPARFLPELSEDPETLLEQLIDRSSPGGASPNPIATTSPGRSQTTTSLLRGIQDLLTAGSDVFLTPMQTATLYQAASAIEGVTTETDVVDPLGRQAVRLSWVVDYNIGAGSVVEWYFDPDTGQFLGQIWRNAGSGTVEGSHLVEMAGISSSLDAPPPADRRNVEKAGQSSA
jgi:hypothetical protein